MANPEHVKILRQGVEVWNRWREDNPDVKPLMYNIDFSGTQLARIAMDDGNFRNVSLYFANLTSSKFDNVDFTNSTISNSTWTFASMINSNLTGSFLTLNNAFQTNLNGATLDGASILGCSYNEVKFKDVKFRLAIIRSSVFQGCDLTNADFSKTSFGHTIFAESDLSSCIGLETCHHSASSSIDFETLRRSWPLPKVFLRGIGLPEEYIDYLPSLIEASNTGLSFYKSFISYSHTDMEFADKLHDDLEERGVRCWRDNKDLGIGEEIYPEVIRNILSHDKIILILSESSVSSRWIEREVKTTLEKEQRNPAGTKAIMPIRIDDAVMDANVWWAHELRQRNIADFRDWKNNSKYKSAFENLIKWLKEQPEKKI